MLVQQLVAVTSLLRCLVSDSDFDGMQAQVRNEPTELLRYGENALAKQALTCWHA